MSGTPALPVRPLTRYTVLRLIGKLVSAAKRWLAGKSRNLTERPGPLVAGDAPQLDGKYRIVRQDPRRGKRLSLGRKSYNAESATGLFTPTPLIVWLKQIS